jgi:ABC-type sugar transport system substrate-binding protein
VKSKVMETRPTRFLCVLAALCLTAVLVAACGGSSSSSSSSEATEATESSGSAEPSGGASSEVSGKKIGYLDVFGTAPIEVRFQKAFNQAVTSLGWSVQLVDAGGEQEKALTAARNMLNSDVDAIVTSSVPGEWILPVLTEAEAKGVPVIALTTKEPPAGFTGQVLESQEGTSEKMVEQIKKEFPNGGEVAIMFEEEQQSLIERTEFVEKGLEGSNIKVVATQNVSAAENAKAQKYTADILNAHPNLVAFITTSDIQSPEIIAGLRTAGNSKVKVYSWYADSANVETMEQSPKQFVAIVDSDIAKEAWIAAGELASFFTGGTITKTQNVEIEPVIVTPADITPGMLAEEGPVPFAEIAAPFEKEWEEKYGTTAE